MSFSDALDVAFSNVRRLQKEITFYIPPDPIPDQFKQSAIAMRRDRRIARLFGSAYGEFSPKQQITKLVESITVKMAEARTKIVEHLERRQLFLPTECDKQIHQEQLFFFVLDFLEQYQLDPHSIAIALDKLGATDIHFGGTTLDRVQTRAEDQRYFLRERLRRKNITETSI